MRWNSVAKTIAAAVVFAGSARAGTVGDIQGVYFAPNSFGVPSNLDAPAFIFENTSGSTITNGVFSILGGTGVSTPDSFQVGTIAAGGKFVLELGITTDGGSGHTFFAPVAGGRATSDVGPDADNVQFRFTGLQGSTTVDTGIFTPAATRGQSNDNTTSINFLGLDDGPCNNCFGPKVIATMSTIQAVPEPSSVAQSAVLVAVGLAGLLARARRGGRR